MTRQLYDLEFERKILGACMLKPELMMELDVSDQDFYSDANRLIWQSMLWLQAEGEPVDTLHVRERLVRLNKLQAVGGDGYLLDLTDTIPAGIPPTKRLRELTRLRTLRESALNLLKTIDDEGDLEKAQAAASELQLWSTEATDANLITAFDCAVDVFEVLSGKSKKVLDVHPGLPVMAEAIGDLAVGSLTVIGADSNVGKSSIALEMLIHAAHRTVVCGYISREDPRVLIGRRLLSMMSGIPAKRIRQRDIRGQDEWGRLAHAAGELQEIGARFLVDTKVGGNELDVCAAMTRMAQRGARLVVIDYAQAIELSGKAQDRRNEVAKVASRLKSHANRVGVALVLLSQLTIPQGGEGKEPGKHWLKESRDLTNMAETIVLAWRTEESEWAPIHLKVAKGKDGGLGQQWSMLRSKTTGRLEEVT